MRASRTFGAVRSVLSTKNKHRPWIVPLAIPDFTLHDQPSDGEYINRPFKWWGVHLLSLLFLSLMSQPHTYAQACMNCHSETVSVSFSHSNSQDCLWYCSAECLNKVQLQSSAFRGPPHSLFHPARPNPSGIASRHLVWILQRLQHSTVNATHMPSS